MSVPQVSAIVLACNHEGYINDCLTSVLTQASDVSLEILVGDDQSDDGTSEIIARLAARHPDLISHIRHERRLGGTGNYQFLVRQARGEFTAYLDGDDFWLPGKLAAQARFLAEHPSCPAVYANAIVIDNDGAPRGIFNNPQPTLLDLGYLLRRGNFLHNSSMMYRTALRTALLDEVEGLIDYRVHLSLARLGPVGYLNRALTVYRQGSNSSAIVHANEKIREFYWQALRDIPRESVDVAALSSGMADFLRRVLMRSIRVRRLGLIRTWLQRVLAEAPVGPAIMLARMAASVLWFCTWAVLDWISAHILRNRLKVFYRR
jgi:glycosyltransferase involved in cell wall biosynthesis